MYQSWEMDGVPDCNLCGTQLRNTASSTIQRAGHEVTRDFYTCPSCGGSPSVARIDAEACEPFWKPLY